MSKDKIRQHSPWDRQSEARYTANAVELAPESCRPALRAYADWLGYERGLSTPTITVRIRSARCFVAAVSEGEISVGAAFGQLDVYGVEDFFVGYCAEKGRGARRNMQTSMRLFLRFGACQGWNEPELVSAVPSLRTYALRGVPRGISKEDLSRLLESLSEEGTSARNRAIITLLALYGVRRGHVAALHLNDVDWRGHTITFRAQKAGKRVEHVLSSAVAEPLAEYIRRDRPTSDSSYIFLRSSWPHLPLSPTAITQMVRDRLQLLGIECVPLGPHALRHAFATRMLGEGQSIKSIADLLGHRSLSATSIYAKVDYLRLFEVAVEWPEVRS